MATDPRKCRPGTWKAVGRFYCLFGLLFGFIGAGCSSLTVYRENADSLPIIVPRAPAPLEEEAARELARVLGAMSGRTWPMMTESGPGDVGIHVGLTEGARRWGPSLQPARDMLRPAPGEIGPDGFRIRFREGSVYVEGATPRATRFGVSWMLQRWAGVNWYSSDSRGEEIPRRSSLTFPHEDIERQPGYLSREIYGLSGTEGEVWGVRNGLGGRFEFGHALSRVFPRPLLEAFPQWQPDLFGQRYLPVDDSDYHWQPNLADPALAEVAAHRAGRAFEDDPERLSFSLGINDSVRFDQSEATRAWVEPLRFFRGMPDYSALVFGFMNRAAEALGTDFPGRTLGCLAYFWCENPPPFQVNSRVVPYLTTDRAQYYDAAYRRDDLELMTRWAKSGAGGFGLWEYGYGQGFLVPRVPHRALADAIQEGWKRGARGYFAEVGPHAGYDAFKVWMMARLLWEPEVSFDALFEEFFTGYYRSSAQPMRQFFELAEERWMKQSGPPYWIKYYQHEDQALLFPLETVDRLRSFLDRASLLAAGDAVVEFRVKQTARAFAVTEAFLAFDAVRRELAQAWPGSGPLVELAGTPQTLGSFLEHRDRFIAAYEQARSGPDPAVASMDLNHFLRNDPVPRLLWGASVKNPSRAGELLRESGARSSEEGMWRTLAFALGTTRPSEWSLISKNSDFAQTAESPLEPKFLFARFGPMPAEWIVRAAPAELSQVSVQNRVSPALKSIVRVEGAWDTQIFQWHPVTRGHSYLALARMRGRTSPGNDSGLFLTFLDAGRKPVGIHRMQTLPKGESEAERLMVLADEPPLTAVWVGVGIGASRQVAGDWMEVSSVELKVSPRSIP